MNVLERKSINARVNHGEFITNLYCKPTDVYQYLHFELSHPSHTKSSIIFSQALRMRRVCSKKSDLFANVRNLKVKHLKEVYQVIVEQGYPW